MRYFERLACGETPTAEEWNEYLQAFHARYENVTSGPCSVMRTAHGETSYQLLARRAREIAPHGKDVIDIGCGDGLLLRRVREQFPDADLVGIDVSEDEIARARSLFSGASFLCSDAREMDLGAKRYDLALLHLTLSIFAQPERVLQAARAALRGGGALLALTERSPMHVSLAGIVDAGIGVLRDMRPAVERLSPNFGVRDGAEAAMFRAAGFTGNVETESHSVGARFTWPETWGVVLRLYPFGLLDEAERERVREAIEERAWQPEADGRMEIRVNLRLVSAR